MWSVSLWSWLVIGVTPEVEIRDHIEDQNCGCAECHRHGKRCDNLLLIHFFKPVWPEKTKPVWAVVYPRGRHDG